MTQGKKEKSRILHVKQIQALEPNSESKVKKKKKKKKETKNTTK